MKKVLTITSIIIVALFCTACNNTKTATDTSIEVSTLETLPLFKEDLTTTTSEDNSEITTIDPTETVSESVSVEPVPEPSINTENIVHLLPIFEYNSIAQDYAKSQLIFPEFIDNFSQTLDSTSYIVECPRVFNENGNIVVIFINMVDGYLYKDTQNLGIRAEECINLDELSELPSTEEAIKEAYYNCITEFSAQMQFLLSKTQKQTGFAGLAYPKLFKENSSIMVLYIHNGYLYKNTIKMFPCEKPPR